MSHPYASALYAGGLAPAGKVLTVPAWGTPVLLRAIAGTDWFDAAGCYPRAALAADADLAGGLRRLAEAGAVAVVLVPDPTGGPDAEALGAAFPVIRPFKRHYVVDRSRGEPQPSPHHRRYINAAAKRCTAARVELAPHLDAWCRLYAGLVERHGIAGVQAFSPAYFEMLTRLPGLVAFAAQSGGRIIAMTLWIRHEDRAIFHLGASDDEGYRVRAQYLLAAEALAHFADCRIVDFGGNAGNSDNAEDGLATFKRGFANAELQSYLCGAVLRPDLYRRLAGEASATSYFPAYRRAA
jgi:hypothetical protein